MKIVNCFLFACFSGERWKSYVNATRVLLVGILLLSALNSRANLREKIRVENLNLTYEQLFRTIEKQVGLTVVYNNDRLDKAEQVALSSNNLEVEQIFEELLEKKSLTYELKDNYIILKPSKEKSSSEAAVQQKKTKVTGKVVDETGAAMPGISIVIKGTTIGTVTNFEGEFDLIIDPAEHELLMISFIGYETQELELAGKNRFEVVMKEQSADIDEVIVTGYQKVDRKLFTGSAVRLKAKDIKIEGISDVSRSLQGNIAGVEIENVSGTFGTAPIMRIRGNASIKGANRPLIVVDGVVMEDVVELSDADVTSGDLTTILSSPTAGINPEDIETFDVLKDASATSLYGARAMNGVIVITTKKGSKDRKPSVSYSTSLTVRQKPTYSQFDIMTSGEEMAVYQELYEKGWIDIAKANAGKHHGVMQDMFYKINNDELSWGKNGSLNYDYLQRYANANTDWFDELFQTSVMQQHSLSITQGSEKASFRASLGYMTDPGQTVADEVDNLTGMMRGDFNLSEKLRVGLKLSGNVRNQRVPASEKRKFNAISGEYERDFDINPFNYALYTSRSMTPYDENGELQFFRRNYAPFNIFHEIDNNKVDLDIMDLIAQADFDYKVSKALNINGTVQGRWYNSKAVHKVHESSNYANAYRADDPVFRDDNTYLFDDEQNPHLYPYSILPYGGIRKTTENGLNSYMARFSANYNPHIHDDHAVNLLFGGELRYADRTDDYNEGWGYMFDKGGLVQTDPNFVKYLKTRGLDYFKAFETYSRSLGVFANSGYSYKGKYIVNGTFRYDGDNRTGTSRQARYLPTWNISGAWNLHAESFLESCSLINQLKVKATYGLTGNNPTGIDLESSNAAAGVSTSAALLLYGKEPLRPHTAASETGLEIEYLANNALTFEKLYEFNCGFELAMLNNRIAIEAEYWNRNSKDLLGYVETNGVGGISQKLGNIGELKIIGIDFSINTVNVKTGNFTWRSMFNYSKQEDEITNWFNNDRVGDLVKRTGGNLEGYSRGSLFSIPFKSLDNNGIPVFYSNEGDDTYYINMQERENVLDHLRYEGTTTPKGYGGFTNSFSYKNFGVSIGLVFRHGNKIRLDDAFDDEYNDYSSLSGQLVNRWQFEGDENITIIPAIIDEPMQQKLEDAGLNPFQLYNKSNVRVAKGDFVRLKNISLNYSLPSHMLDNSLVRAASFSLSGYNLALLYSDEALHGIDPEFYQSGGLSMPMAPMYTFTMNLKF